MTVDEHYKAFANAMYKSPAKWRRIAFKVSNRRIRIHELPMCTKRSRKENAK